MNIEPIEALTEGLKALSETSKIFSQLLAPKTIKATAKAEAQAELIKTASSIGLTPKELKALRRKSIIAQIENTNLDKILETSNKISEISEERLKLVYPDWLHKFIKYASCISDEDVQNLWAKILVGEVNKPGTYSLQTISTQSLIDQNIAIQIQKLFQFIISIENNIYIFIPSQVAPYLKRKQIFIDEDNLLQLESLGIININEGYLIPKLHLKNRNPITIKYGDKTIVFKPKKVNENNYTYFELGQIALTRIGKEIYLLRENTYSEEIFDSIRYNLSRITDSKVKY